MNRRLMGTAVVLGLAMTVQPVAAAATAADVGAYGGSGTGGGAVTRVVDGATQSTPVASWLLPPGTYDGIGSWIIPGNVPTAAGAGQAAPAYAAVHEFNFVNNKDSDAFLVLGIDGTERFAEFSVFWSDGRETRARLPFNWQANRWYFPFAYKAGNGVWAGFVYDLTAQASTYIGSLVLPVDWGGIDARSNVYVIWFGDDPAACSGYPIFDVYRLSPSGFVGQAVSQSTLPVNSSNPGDCSGTLAGQPTAAWSHFVMGG